MPQAPIVNLLNRLKQLARTEATPAHLAIKIVTGIGALVAGSVQLESGHGPESIPLLRQAYELVGEVHARQPNSKAGSAPDELGIWDLQLLRLLLPCQIKAGQHGPAALLASAYLERQQGTDAGEAPTHHHDIWLLWLQARIMLQQRPAVARDVLLEAARGLGPDTTAAALTALLRCPPGHVQIEAECLDSAAAAAKSCVARHGAAAADTVLSAVEGLLGCGGLMSAQGSASSLGEDAALELLSEGTVQAALQGSKAQCHALLHTVGVAHFQARRFAEARRLFVGAYAYAPPSVEPAAARLVAACSHELGMFDIALAYLEHAEQQSPGCSATVLLRVRVMMRRGGADVHALLQQLELLTACTDFHHSHLQVRAVPRSTSCFTACGAPPRCMRPTRPPPDRSIPSKKVCLVPWLVHSMFSSIALCCT